MDYLLGQAQAFQMASTNQVALSGWAAYNEKIEDEKANGQRNRHSSLRAAQERIEDGEGTEGDEGLIARYS